MKNSKIKVVAFSLLFFLVGGLFLFIGNDKSNPLGEKSEVMASYHTGDSYFSTSENTENSTLIENGYIPFSLFTSVEYAGDAGFSITDYYPEFETSVRDNTYYYTMTEDSVPYILLSSKSGNEANDILTTLYSSTLHFRFNDLNAKTDPGINYGKISELGHMQMSVTVRNSPTDDPIVLDAGPDYVIAQEDNMYSFALNLQELMLNGVENPNVECPELALNDGDVDFGEEEQREYLGGNGESNDVSKRTGLYTFTIRYNYTSSLSGQFVSNTCVFTMSLYVVDYSEYVSDGENPLTFENADSYIVDGETYTKDYKIYNYNYENAPVVNYDASKFALNFVYKVGGDDSVSNTYHFNYQGFVVDHQNGHTGIVTLHCLENNNTYSFYTYDDGNQENGTQYLARFDLDDFEKNYIMVNQSYFNTSVFQGIYEFELDILTQGDGSVPYTHVDKDLFSEEIRESLTYERLIIFGYDLRYEDKDTSSPTYNQVLPLVNDYTYNTIASYNAMTTGLAGDDNSEVGNLFSIPNLIATTNITPLRFHSYGTLSDYTATYRRFDSFTTSDEEILEALKSMTTLEEIDAYIREDDDTYSQEFQNITASGTYLMKLEYTIDVSITQVSEDKNDTRIRYISGCQYVLFKIESGLQPLYVHGIDENIAYDFVSATNKNVRVAIEKRDNLFSNPVTVSYSYASDFVNNSSSGTLSLKRGADNQLETFTINGKEYYYYVINNSLDYTFTNNGRYTVTIRSLGNTAKSYGFSIDKEDISDISVNSVTRSSLGTYVKSNPILSSDLSGYEYIDKDLYVTDSAFTVGWAPKSSGIKEYVSIYVMDLKRGDDVTSSSLFKQTSGEYWLTNNYYFDTLKSGDSSSYQNSYNLTTLEANSYFFRPGLYYFFIYDDAGNYSGITVLIDDTLPQIAQGSWSGIPEESAWQNSYSPTTNPNNFINSDTVLYFGTHKALNLPMHKGTSADGIFDNEMTLQITDRSYTQAYDLSQGGTLLTKENIIIKFYEDVLLSLSNYVKKTDGGDLFDISWIKNPDRNMFYLLLENENVNYSYFPIDVSKAPSSGTYTPAPVSVALYLNNNNAIFNGEADYVFSLLNENGLQIDREVHVSLDNIRSSFYAYNDPDERYYIRKNAGTNLNTLVFEYTILNNDLSEYYDVAELYYDFYPFALNENDANFSITSYPFSSVPAETRTTLTVTSPDGITYTTGAINPDYATSEYGITEPGMYVITRVYRGGPYDYDENGDIIYVGTGGSLYLGDDGKYYPLFTLDPKTKSYTVYVDHNGIISENYLSDNTTREVGNNISITLNNDANNSYSFKEFFKMSGSRSLTTNEVPIEINIPVSKYFIYTQNGTQNYLHSELNFTRLNVEIVFTNSLGVSTTYIIDGYDSTTGMCTSSMLKSTSNPNGNLIFDEEGSYQIIITDNTGYTLSDSSSTSLNVNPTRLEFSFQIKHSSPSAIAHSYVYSSITNRFEEKTQTDEYGNHIYAINAEAGNIQGEYNKFYLSWQDDRTPYLSKSNYITINYVLNNQARVFSIDFSRYDLNEIASQNLVILLSDVNSNITVVSKDLVNLDSFLFYLTIEYYDVNNPYEVYDGQNYYRYVYTLNFGLNKECTYEVSFSHDLGNNYEFKTTTYQVSIDRTKPSTNLDSLLNSEDFLRTYYSDSLNSFKEEDFDISNLYTLPSALTYTFGLNYNYVLNYNEGETVPYFYIRSYNKYNGEYASITPDMSNTEYYQNEDMFGRYPKFSETTLINGVVNIGDEIWYQAEYSNSSLYSIIQSVTGVIPSGYYEIIERDYAGNYRTFTVYFAPQGSSSYDILRIDGRDAIRDTFESSTGDNLTAESYFTLTELSSRLGFGVVLLRNETLNLNFDTPIYLTPEGNISSSLLERINTFLSGGGVNINCRYSFTLSRYNASYPSIVKSVSVISNETNAKLSAPTIIEVPNIETGTSTYNLQLPAYSTTSVLYLTSFQLYRFSNVGNTWELTQYSYDDRDEIRLNNPIRGLSAGVYRAVYTDNYNTTSYEYILYVGEYRLEDFDDQYNFTYNYVIDNETLTYYTGGDVTITYEGNIYSVYVNGVLYSGTPNEYQPENLKPNNLKRFNLTSNYSYDNIPANQSVGGTSEYVIEYRDRTNGQVQKTMRITIFDYLPNILLTNNDDESDEISSTLEESESQITNSSVRINFGLITNCGYDLLNDSETNEVTIATLYTRDANGLYRNGVTIPRGNDGDRNLVSEEGYYRLDLTNRLLGNTRSVYFVIKLGDFPLYTVSDGDTTLSPSPYETLNITLNNSQNLVHDMNNRQTSILNAIYSILTSMRDNGSFDGNSDRNEREYNMLVESMGFRNGNFSQANIGTSNVLNLNHYYSVNLPSITYNSNINLDIIEFTFENSMLRNYFMHGDGGSNPTPSNDDVNYWTTIYLVYSLRGPIRIELFAVTKVPRSTNLIGNTIYYNETESILIRENERERDLTNANGVVNNQISLHWNSLNPSQTTYWYNQGNFIYVMEQYGADSVYVPLDYTYNSSNNRNSSILQGAGTHKIMFRDLAGNTHSFSTSSMAIDPNVYTINLITQVIYYINYNNEDYNPIQYGIFNDSLSLVIDSNYASKISRYNISVMRNGAAYNSYTREDNVYTFTAPGRYVVTLTGAYQGNDLNSTTYNFTIVSTTSARLAFEFTRVLDYEIIQVIRNNEDITNNFMVNGSISSLFISSQDSRSGNGYYTVTLKYGDRDDEVLQFSFFINDYEPTLSSNVAYGETTTSEIIISYNPSYIYSQLGVCYINVLIYNEDSETFYQYGRFRIDETTTETLSSFNLTQSNSYFIQVETESGNIVSSFRVNKTDPLNTFAIIIIVIAVVATIVLIIVVIKLRTRMRVR